MIKEGRMVAIADFRDAFYNRHILARKWKEEGKKVFGYMYSFVPEEIIYAADIIPVQLTESEDAEVLRKGKTVLPEFFCNLSISICGQGMDEVYSYLDGVVFCDSCPQVRAFVDVWDIMEVKPPFFFWLTYPCENDEGSKKFYLSEINRLKTRIEDFVGKKISEDALRHAIEIYNENRNLIKKMYALREQDNPPILGSEVFEVVKASLIMPKEEHNAMLRELLEKEIPARPERDAQDRPRIMAYAYTFEECNTTPFPNFIKMIEDLGAEIVCDELTRSPRYYWEPVEPKADLIEALVDRYLGKVPIAQRIPHTVRINNILESYEKYRAQGIIFFLSKYCMSYWFQHYLVEKEMKERGIPFISIETLALMPEAPVRTRIEAFIEMLR
jgi:benzoyl-CoA reductase subunit C